MRLITFLLILFLAGIANARPLETITVSLQISSYSLTAEVVHTPSSRAQGLMHRESLAKNHGMLFIFPVANYYSMWMLNTNIPLSVAFIDEQGLILNISDMEPHTRILHSSLGIAKYALEMNQGWFASKGIKPGEKVIGLDKTPKAD